MHTFSQRKSQDSRATLSWHLSRDCCSVQSLCNSLCARPEVVLLGWNSWAMTVRTTHTYNWNRAEFSFALLASRTTFFQAWCIALHGIDSSGQKAQRTHICMTQYIIYMWGWCRFELYKHTRQKVKRHISLHVGLWDCTQNCTAWWCRL